MSQENLENKMSFFEHVEELRSRVMTCLFVFFLGFCICYAFATDWLMDFLKAPLFKVMGPDQQKLYFTNLFENFLVHLKISAVGSIVLFVPFYLYQLWAFVAPGLYPHERRWIVPFIVAGSGCFLGGAAFAYYVLFPLAFKFFVTYGTATDVPLLTIEAYYTTVLKLLLLFGLAFELPVIVCFFGFLGVIDSQMLKKYRQYAYIGITVMSALFAPPDVLSMLLLMAPLLFLYESSIWIVHWLGAKRESRIVKHYQFTEQASNGVSDGHADYPEHPDEAAAEPRQDPGSSIKRSPR